MIEDAKLLSKWLSDEKVLQYYEGRDQPFDLDKVEEKFFNEEKGRVYRNIILCDETPIGYIQYYPLSDTEKRELSYQTDEFIYGMDQFIGEVDYWNKGIGTRLVNMVIDYLVKEIGVTRIVMDPQAWNSRAIRCYEKCGFIKKKFLPEHEWHEGKYRDCWLIEYQT